MRIYVVAFLPSLRSFAVPDNRIGILSSSMFGGMMIGAVGWGTCECFFIGTQQMPQLA